MAQGPWRLAAAVVAVAALAAAAAAQDWKGMGRF